MKLLFLFLIVIPVIEVSLFVVVGGMLGLAGTLLEITLTGLLGVYLLRRLQSENMRAYLEKINFDSSESITISQVFRPVMLFISGFLLALPGFLTDFLGIILLLPHSELFFFLLLFPLLPRFEVPSTPSPDDVPEKESITLEGKYRRDDNK